MAAIPTSGPSTAAMLALGDALALTVMELRSFGREDYATRHPGGALGRSLMKAQEIMRSGADEHEAPAAGAASRSPPAGRKL